MKLIAFRDSAQCHSTVGRKVWRGGFTLVEMLVAVGLVVLMMSLFAEIFQIATQSMQKQKATGELDQKARVVETVLRADLNSRTFRMLSPFKSGENTTALNANMDLRRGYFYIAENVVGDDTDDVLQLTVDKRLGPTPDTTLFYGRTVSLQDINGNSNAPNQPQYDDGQPAVDNAGSSPTAEVAYFLRNGTLYRRVLLIRQPLVAVDPINDADPEGTGNNVTGGNVTISSTVLDSMKNYRASNVANARNFWTDFDYSAYPGPSTFASLGGQVITAQFHSQGDLNNAQGGSLVSCLGLPQFRFGYSDVPGSTYGNPIEYIGTGAGTTFIGRFTKEETSNPFFVYPGSVDTSTPVSGAVVPNLTVTGGVVDQYADGIRAGEDILLTNVTGFDIKVWDPGASFGADGRPGFAGPAVTGDTILLPPLTPAANITFDWLNNVLGYQDDNLNGIADDVYEIGWPGSDDGAFVDLGHQTAINGNQVGFYNRQAIKNSTYSPLNSYRFDTWHPNAPDIINNSTGVITPDGFPDPPPFRPVGFGTDRKPGKGASNSNPTDPRFDDNGNSVVDYDYTAASHPPDFGELEAAGSDDSPIPLSAIQIKIRFFDITSNQTREITMVVSLQD